MPIDDSSRKQAIAQLVVVLGSVTTGADYINTFTGDRVVSSQLDLDDERLTINSVTIRVRDGVEEHRRRLQTPEEGATAEFNLMVDILLQHASGDDANLVNELQDVIRDVMHAIAKHRTLNGVVNDAFVDRIEESVYDAEHRLAATLLRVHCEYDYLPSVTT